MKTVFLIGSPLWLVGGLVAASVDIPLTAFVCGLNAGLYMLEALSND